MIGGTLMLAISAARVCARRAPDLYPATLEALAEAVDVLLDLTGEEMAPLRDAGRRMAVLLYRAEQLPAQWSPITADLMREAVLVTRLERGLRPGGVPALLLPPPARHRAFTVIQGGRA